MVYSVTGNYFHPFTTQLERQFWVEAPSDLSFRNKLLNCNYQPLLQKALPKGIPMGSKNLSALIKQKTILVGRIMCRRYCWHLINLNWMTMKAIWRAGKILETGSTACIKNHWFKEERKQFLKPGEERNHRFLKKPG